MTFSSVPVRANGRPFINHSWWNDLRTAGVWLETLVQNFLGSDVIAKTTFTLANNQSSWANIAGLLLDSTKGKSAYIFVQIRRKTDSSEIVSAGRLIALYRDSTNLWDVEFVDEIAGDAHGCSFQLVDSTGEAQYKTDNMAGTNYSGSITFRALYL